METIEETVAETHEEWALRKRREAMKVTRFQAKSALLESGLLAEAEQAVDASTDPLVKLAWKEAGFERLSPMVIKLGKDMQLTDEQLDNLFDTAKRIKA